MANVREAIEALEAGQSMKFTAAGVEYLVERDDTYTLYDDAYSDGLMMVEANVEDAAYILVWLPCDGEFDAEVSYLNRYVEVDA